MSLNNQLFALLLISLFFPYGSLVSKPAELGAYCKTSRCGLKNLACRNSRNLSITCAPGSKVVSLSPYREHLLHQFNSFRNKVAAGYTRTLFPAGRMARMAWSTELENFAKMYIKKCVFNPRPCMASVQFTAIGSIYDGLSYSGSQKSHKIPEITEELLNGWFEDARFVTRELSLRLRNEFTRPTVRQAVLLMADRNTHVGCSALRLSNGMVNQFFIACTFATDNILNKPIYKVRATAGSLCKQRDSTYKNLCALGEVYNNQREYKPGELLPSSSELFSEVEM
ncbi:allergen Tab y 5.0101-like [Drosophila novamexicana]|uniref:allergen Tab y 5.0101-like n=1 Tax=Drosophila novamexicana TaxID=47314 RepID=UPI0011E595E0|nr:allergen Tab y 5.0101-like [Drosophila novamexicana]